MLRLIDIYTPQDRRLPLPPIIAPHSLLMTMATLGTAVIGYRISPLLALGFLWVTLVLLAQWISPAIRSLAVLLPSFVSNLIFLLPLLLFFLPHFLSTISFPPPSHWSSWGALAALSFAAFLHCWNLPLIRKMFNREYCQGLPTLPLITVSLRTYQGVVSSIAQEIFYRGSLFTLFEPTLHWLVIPLCASLFTGEHYANRWGKTLFNKKDYGRFFFLGIGMGIVVYTTDSVMAAILGHLFYNSIGVAQLWFRYFHSRSTT